ncbi:hypothetical protein D3C86_1141920 [compost metagenome]
MPTVNPEIRLVSLSLEFKTAKVPQVPPRTSCTKSVVSPSTSFKLILWEAAVATKLYQTSSSAVPVSVSIPESVAPTKTPLPIEEQVRFGFAVKAMAVAQLSLVRAGSVLTQMSKVVDAGSS